jgi:hypothetical protein
LFLANYQAEITILDSLHPRMPKKSVMIRAIAFGWIVDVGDRNKPVRGKLLYQPDHIPARDMELFGQMIEGRPGVASSTGKIGQVRVKFLRLLGDLGTFFQPLRKPHTVKEAVRVYETPFRSGKGSEILFAWFHPHRPPFDCPGKWLLL